MIGITAATFLQSHFSVWGTRLILLTGMFIGLLLAADDLVLRTPGVAMATMQQVRIVRTGSAAASEVQFSDIAKTAVDEGFVTRDTVMLRPPKPAGAKAAKATYKTRRR